MLRRMLAIGWRARFQQTCQISEIHDPGHSGFRECVHGSRSRSSREICLARASSLPRRAMITVESGMPDTGRNQWSPTNRTTTRRARYSVATEPGSSPSLGSRPRRRSAERSAHRAISCVSDEGRVDGGMFTSRLHLAFKP